MEGGLCCNTSRSSCGTSAVCWTAWMFEPCLYMTMVISTSGTSTVFLCHFDRGTRACHVHADVDHIFDELHPRHFDRPLRPECLEPCVELHWACRPLCPETSPVMFRMFFVRLQRRRLPLLNSRDPSLRFQCTGNFLIRWKLPLRHHVPLDHLNRYHQNLWN